MLEEQDTEVLNPGGDDQILVTYRRETGVIAYRIPQRDLERLRKLENLVIAAREEIQQRLDEGFKEETGSLIVDREAFECSVERRKRYVRPARTREGKRPRVFVLSSRERFHVQAWSRGENNDDQRTAGILSKLNRRTLVVLQRDCLAMRQHRNWSDLGGLLKKEVLFWGRYLSIRTLFSLRGVVGRSLIGALFNAQMTDFQRKVPCQ